MSQFKIGDQVMLESNDYKWIGNILHMPHQVVRKSKYTITVKQADGKCEKEYTGIFGMFRKVVGSGV